MPRYNADDVIEQCLSSVARAKTIFEKPAHSAHAKRVGNTHEPKQPSAPSSSHRHHGQTTSGTRSKREPAAVAASAFANGKSVSFSNEPSWLGREASLSGNSVPSSRPKTQHHHHRNSKSPPPPPAPGEDNVRGSAKLSRKSHTNNSGAIADTNNVGGYEFQYLPPPPAPSLEEQVRQQPMPAASRVRTAPSGNALTMEAYGGSTYSPRNMRNVATSAIPYSAVANNLQRSITQPFLPPATPPVPLSAITTSILSGPATVTAPTTATSFPFPIATPAPYTLPVTQPSSSFSQTSWRSDRGIIVAEQHLPVTDTIVSSPSTTTLVAVEPQPYLPPVTAPLQRDVTITSSDNPLVVAEAKEPPLLPIPSLSPASVDNAGLRGSLLASAATLVDLSPAADPTNVIDWLEKYKVSRKFYVDPRHGVDATALPDDPSRSFFSVDAAITASKRCDTYAILVLAPGRYDHDIELPPNVGLVGATSHGDGNSTAVKTHPITGEPLLDAEENDHLDYGDDGDDNEGDDENDHETDGGFHAKKPFSWSAGSPVVGELSAHRLSPVTNVVLTKLVARNGCLVANVTLHKSTGIALYIDSMPFRPQRADLSDDGSETENGQNDSDTVVKQARDEKVLQTNSGGNGLGYREGTVPDEDVGQDGSEASSDTNAAQICNVYIAGGIGVYADAVISDSYIGLYGKLAKVAVETDIALYMHKVVITSSPRTDAVIVASNDAMVQMHACHCVVASRVATIFKLSTDSALYAAECTFRIGTAGEVFAYSDAVAASRKKQYDDYLRGAVVERYSSQFTLVECDTESSAWIAHCLLDLPVVACVVNHSECGIVLLANKTSRSRVNVRASGSFAGAVCVFQTVAAHDPNPFPQSLPKGKVAVTGNAKTYTVGYDDTTVFATKQTETIVFAYKDDIVCGRKVTVKNCTDRTITIVGRSPEDGEDEDYRQHNDDDSDDNDDDNDDFAEHSQPRNTDKGDNDGADGSEREEDHGSMDPVIFDAPRINLEPKEYIVFQHNGTSWCIVERGGAVRQVENSL